jgi:hypothetical protein
MSSHLLEKGEGGENEDVGLGPDEDHVLLVVVPEQDDMNPSRAQCSRQCQELHFSHCG